ncbi:MAG: RNA methyltransferase [Azonexus sp.]|nr:RNA methyltransferase [Betaproteobacteria bacterium]MBP6036423.1 RNA methyltransferase [Azonexus sp.]MBP6907032.1 RNA methyltransferase [Azonexus sp.]
MSRIESRDNPLVRRLRRLGESARECRKEERTLLEGFHLVAAYEEALGPVETLVVSDTGAKAPEIAAYLVGRRATSMPDGLFRSLSTLENPSGLLALAPIPRAPGPLPLDEDCVLLDGVQDPGNVGTLIRTAVAAGFRHLLLSSECAGAWMPKVLRAGQGAHFSATVHEDADLEAFLARYHGGVAATSLGESVPLWDAALEAPLAWIFGAEGRGVRAALLERAGIRVRIPMAAGVESLNVGAAAAICLFETQRRRSS